MPRRETPRLATALVLLLSSGVGIAQETAQSTDRPEGEEQLDEKEVVTGTRIRREDPTTPAALTVITRDRILASGKASLGDFLQTLPEQGNAINGGVNDGDGSTRVNLRGIGTSRTLVLVNGRRWMPGGSGADGSVDLSSIPSAAVERIEVLKDGASAVYGSDAIAGVVNVVTRRRTGETGVSLFTGTSGQGDGTTFDVNLTTGLGNDRANLLFSAGYSDRREVMARDREFSRFPWFYDFPGGRYTLGSSAIPAGLTLASGASGTGNALWSTLEASGASGYVWTTPDDPNVLGCGTSASGRTSCFREYLGDGLPAAGDVAVGDGYNVVAERYLVTPQQRLELFSTGDLELGSVARVFLEASYVNRRSSQQISPAPLFSDFVGSSVSAYNLYNPFDKDVFVRRRLVELGPGRTRQDVDAYRILGGVGGRTPGSFGPLAGWDWEVSLGWGRVEAASTQEGRLYLPVLAVALGPSMMVNGTPTCVSTPGDASTAIPGCVPLDLFGGPGSITPDQLSGLTFTGRISGLDELWSAQANASGEIFRIAPGRAVGLAVGYEYREHSGAFLHDPVTAQGLTTSPVGLDTRGSYRVNEVHGELSIPIVEELEATAAARWFDYSTFGSDTSYLLGARWRSIPDVTVRGTVSTAFRAPTIQESFGAQAERFPLSLDPCRGASAGGPPVVAGTTLGDTCTAQGVPVGGNGDVQLHHRALVGGNPDVGPETARGRTIGIVLEPRWVRNLSVTLGYYDLEIEGTVGSWGETVLLTGCYSGANPGLCSHVVRDPATSLIDTIVDLNDNVGKLSTAGLDLAVRYALPTPGAGRFGFALDANWLRRVDQTLPDGTVVHGKSTFDLNRLNSGGGAGGTFPAWKANAGVTWGLGGLGAGLSTRFLGSFHECGSPYDADGDFTIDGADFSGAGLCYVDSRYQRTVRAYHTEDLFVSYTMRTFAGRTDVMLGVQNLGDAKPAEIYNGFASSTDQYNYDQVGRFFYVRLSQAY